LVNVSKDPFVVSPIVEVPERSEQADGQIEGIWALEVAHVPLNPLDADTLSLGQVYCVSKQEWREIHPRNAEPSLRESGRMPPWPTRQIQNLSAVEAGNLEHAIDLLFRAFEFGLREHERVELLPVLFVFKPLAHVGGELISHDYGSHFRTAVANKPARRRAGLFEAP